MNIHNYYPIDPYESLWNSKFEREPEEEDDSDYYNQERIRENYYKNKYPDYEDE